MHRTFYSFLFLGFFLLCYACTPASEPVTWQEDEQGITYWIVADSIGTDTAKIGQKIKLHLEILKADSTIYNSRDRGEALEFLFSEKLFSGAFGSSLSKMTPGDSALLKMKSTQFYPAGRPSGLAETDSINCRIKLLEVFE